MSTSLNLNRQAHSLPELLAHCGKVALFLDFDGVLAEISPTPDGVEVAPETIARLQTLNSTLNGALAVISGREIDSLDKFLAPLHLAVAGEHGNRRRTVGGDMALLNAAAAVAAAAIHDDVVERFGDDPRILVEHKPSAVAVHYRLAPERESECIEAMTAAVRTNPQLSLIKGKMVVEGRAAGVNKGTAVRAFMGEPPFEARVPIFIGDDVTDEDGFVASQDFGGAGIKVGAGDTAAHYRIGGTADVAAVLDSVIESQRWAK